MAAFEALSDLPNDCFAATREDPVPQDRENW
jgi:hypothetical protein